jgi:cytochrome bd-type quinol oxidase subunit 2
VILVLPIVIADTGWAYRMMRGTVTERAVREGGHY